MRLRFVVPLLLAGTAACSDEVTPAEPSPAVLFSCLFGEARELEVGEIAQAAGPDAEVFCLGGGADGAEYVFVPFFASERGTANLAIEITGGGLEDVAGPPNPALSPSGSLGTLRSVPESPRLDEEFHLRLRERMVRELTPLIPSAREIRANRALRPGPSPRFQEVPAEGDLLTINASLAPCEEPDLRTARVAAVSDKAIIVVDTANPVGGFTQEDFRFVGETFDTLIFPVDSTYFGAPTDIDENNRVIIFYTVVVNNLTPPGSNSYVGGFFYGRDLFPSEGAPGLQACPTSNEAEIFYLLAPDPARGGPFTTEAVLQTTLGTVAHEFQHLINASRRLYVNPNAEFPEETWLNEGLSHIAEEVVFYATTPLEPRQNIVLETLFSTPNIENAFFTYQAANLARYNTYLNQPDTTSLIGLDELPTRGAAWAFLRYAADRKDGPDVPFFFDLANATETGVDNLNQVLGANAIRWMQDWTLSVYTDDAVPGVEPIYMQPSWNFRDIMPAFLVNEGEFPLKVVALESAVSDSLSIQAGGAAFVRFGVVPGGRAVVNVMSGGASPPSSLRISVVRTR